MNVSPQVNANELTNGVINAAFMLLFKDSIRLFAAYNEGIINLLGRTFARRFPVFRWSPARVVMMAVVAWWPKQRNTLT